MHRPVCLALGEFVEWYSRIYNSGYVGDVHYSRTSDFAYREGSQY